MIHISDRVARCVIAVPPDFTVTEADLLGKGFTIEWMTRGAGCGALGFYFEDGKLMLESEHMNKDFIKSVLAKLVDDATIATHEPPAPRPAE